MEGIDPTGRAGRAELAVRADTDNRRGMGVGAFVLALVTAGALAHVGVRMKGIEVAYDLGRERRINTQLEEERRRLNIEIGMLKDPVRVVSIARDKLKMGPPAATDVVRLAPGLVLGVRPEPPAATPRRAERAASARPRPRAERAAPAEAATAEVAPGEPSANERAAVEPSVAGAPAREGDE